jgi:hypothetical protein
MKIFNVFASKNTGKTGAYKAVGGGVLPRFVTH